LIPFDVIPGERQILNIRKVTLYRWATRPNNWIYFRVRNMWDFHLKRLVIRAQEIWGDEWLTIGQAARLIGCDTKSLNMRINRGRIPEARKNGNWYLPKSVAAGITIYPGKGGAKAQKNKSRETTKADEWLWKARYELGMTYEEIAARMKNGWNERSVGYRLGKLKEYRDQDSGFRI